MQWIKFDRAGLYLALFAVQAEGRLSSELANDGEIDEAVAELKRQLDRAAVEAKKALPRVVKEPPF